MTLTKKLIAVTAIALAGTLGVAGVATAHDHHGHHHGHHHDRGLVSSLLRTVGDVLNDL